VARDPGAFAPAVAEAAPRPAGWTCFCGGGGGADAHATALDRCQVLAPVQAGAGLVLLSLCVCFLVLCSLRDTLRDLQLIQQVDDLLDGPAQMLSGFSRKTMRIKPSTVFFLNRRAFFPKSARLYSFLRRREACTASKPAVTIQTSVITTPRASLKMRLPLQMRSSNINCIRPPDFPSAAPAFLGECPFLYEPSPRTALKQFSLLDDDSLGFACSAASMLYPHLGGLRQPLDRQLR
jgi:hypothetical protein